MRETSQGIVGYLKNYSLPESCSDVLGKLYDPATNRFPIQESLHWDYKRDFPYSLSDDYFGGIVRIICAFHNTYGGIIIFGVHDTERTPGHNLVKINIERLNNVLRQTLSNQIQVIHRHYFLGEDGDEKKAIDLLLVPKRPMGVAPVRQIVDIARYAKGIIWMRSGHEVIEPTTQQLPFLYNPRESYGIIDEEPGAEIPNSLPPSPATLHDFVGRRDALDRLYHWLLLDDEPRIFLYGKGGSGKSTIAYEFARAISHSAGRMPTKQGRPIDYVLYLSAKRRALDPVTAKTMTLSSFDFDNADELFRATLELCEWLPLDDIKTLSISDVIRHLGDFTDTAQILLVIDDIDTLTTAGIDPGMDVLYRLLSRSKAGGKVLYTVRNAPSHSLLNSIEVPGLDIQREYSEFVSICCRQFHVPEPDKDLTVGIIAEVSERRPLAIEVIVGLRRTVGNYQDALNLFRTRVGEEARQYLFQREYDALSADNKSRLFLAALALFSRPAKLSDLESVLQFSAEQLRDCIAETLEMFLQTDEVSDEDTSFRLGQATKLFIEEVSRNLVGYEKLKASIKYFKSPFLTKNPHVAQIKFRVQHQMVTKDFQSAYEYLNLGSWNASVTEHPEFNMIKGQVCAKLQPPKYEEARRHFRFAVEHKCNDVQGMRDWYWMEVNSEYNIWNALAACDFVINGKQFKPKAKSEFLSKKGSVLARMGQDAFFGDPELSFQYQRKAISCFLEAYAIGSGEPGTDTGRTESSLFNSLRYFLISVGRMSGQGRQDLALQIVDFMKEQAALRKYEFDAGREAFEQFAEVLGRSAGTGAADANRALLYKLLPTFDKAGGVIFAVEANRAAVIKAIKGAIAKLKG